MHIFWGIIIRINSGFAINYQKKKVVLQLSCMHSDSIIILLVQLQINPELNWIWGVNDKKQYCLHDLMSFI